MSGESPAKKSLKGGILCGSLGPRDADGLGGGGGQNGILFVGTHDLEHEESTEISWKRKVVPLRLGGGGKKKVGPGGLKRQYDVKVWFRNRPGCV